MHFSFCRGSLTPSIFLSLFNLVTRVCDGSLVIGRALQGALRGSTGARAGVLGALLAAARRQQHRHTHLPQ